MAEIWAAGLTAVAAVGSTAYTMSQSSGGGGAAGGGGGLSAGFQPLKLPDMPKLQKNDIWDLQKKGVGFDQMAYGLSDADFKKRHRPIVDAEKLFEQQTLKDQQGDSELMPALQNEYMRAGLQGALSSFGSTPGTLAPGSAGEADVARNLGLSITSLQDRNRDNRTKSLLTAENIFQRRKFGLTGSDAVGITMGNTASENNWNQAKHAEDVSLAQYNATGQANFNNAAQAQQNVNAQAGAQSSAATGQAIMSAADMIAKLGTSVQASRQPTSTVSPATLKTWKPGPQDGTYYMPKAA